MNRYLLPVIVFVSLVGLLGVGLRLNPQELPSPFIGKPAPQFSAARLEDGARSIAPADMRGKVWMLNVWASWCGACRQEHPMLMKLAESGAVPMVGLHYKDKRDDGLHWLRLNGNPYTASAFDPDGRIGIDYGVYGVPETFVIDRAGVIRYKHLGPLTERDIRDKILPLIRELNRA